MSWKSEHVSAEPPLLDFTLLLRHFFLPKGTTVSLWVNPPEPPQPSLLPALAAFSFSKYRLALASPAPSCLPVTTHLSGTPHFLSFSSALHVSILKGSSFFVCSLNILLLNLHIFPLSGLKHSYYFNYHLYADSFQICLQPSFLSPATDLQIQVSAPWAKLAPSIGEATGSAYKGHVNMYHFEG